jgi:hypothetical protein
MITELQGVLKMKKWLMSAALFAAVAVLVGCSAGGKDQGGTTTGTGTGTVTTPTAPTLAIALSANAVTSAAPATVAVTVVNSTGAALPNVVVSFTVNSAVGALSSSTALTNSKGVASVTLSPAAASASGADTVTASATVAGLTGTASAGYQVNSTTASITSIVPGTGDATTDPLSSYGQTTLTLTSTGVSSAAPVTFNLTSACVAAGKATISPTSIAATTNTTTFTYKDSGGCGSTLAADTVTATIAGTSISDSTQVNLTSPTANSITFTSANPPTIFLKGSGYTESSTVSFEVVDTAGNPLPGQQVTLALSTLAGGLLLDQGSTPVKQTSDSNGLVSVIINSGTVPTPVRVTATLQSGVSTESSSLAVVTGLPSQIHFSLSEATANIEGANRDDATNTYTINVADRSGNPVPDGTTVIFWAEGGKITGSAMTTGGVVSVPFVSTTPKPDDGRVTILAYAIGEESFIDQSSNGANVWVQGYPFQDLGDVVKSKQLDGVFDPVNDEIVSLSTIGAGAGTSACVDDSATYSQFTVNSYTMFDGYTPSRPGTCDGTWSGKTYVRKSIETVFSTSAPNALWASTDGLTSSCSAISLYAGPTTTTQPSSYYPLATTANNTWYLGASSSGSFKIIAADANSIRLNPMAAGTAVAIAPDDATVVTLTVAGGSPVANSLTATPVSISYKFLAGLIPIGATITFTSPKGLVTPVHITLNPSAPPTTCP